MTTAPFDDTLAKREGWTINAAGKICAQNNPDPDSTDSLGARDFVLHLAKAGSAYHKDAIARKNPAPNPEETNFIGLLTAARAELNQKFPDTIKRVTECKERPQDGETLEREFARIGMLLSKGAANPKMLREIFQTELAGLRGQTAPKLSIPRN